MKAENWAWLANLGIWKTIIEMEVCVGGGRTGIGQPMWYAFPHKLATW